MKWIVAFLRFWRDFLVGDDPIIAIGVVAMLAVAGVLNAANVSSWWLLPPAVAGVLAVSLRRAIRRSG
jgi:putative intracellular protease/amidase